MKIDIKPLSVNEAWQGKRFKTKLYKSYERALLYELRFIRINPEDKLKISLEFGFSNSNSDIDNPVKPFLDILQKRYKFNDRNIYELNIKKVLVEKGEDYINFDICSIN